MKPVTKTLYYKMLLFRGRLSNIWQRSANPNLRKFLSTIKMGQMQLNLINQG